MELNHLVVDVAIIVAITAIVIFIAGGVIEKASTSSLTLECCKDCHINLNATENASACAECQRIWSNVYT